MKTLSVLGTAAMFLVGGGILTHGWHSLDGVIHNIADRAGEIGGIGFLLKALLPTLLSGLVGILAGLAALAVVSVVGRMFKKPENQPA